MLYKYFIVIFMLLCTVEGIYDSNALLSKCVFYAEVVIANKSSCNWIWN